VLGHISELGADAQGAVAADDLLLAFEDAVADFAPDHILIALRSGERTRWQKRGLLDKVLDRFGLPVTVFRLQSD
jgi:hypothetical protein